jgi:hypothetical protein
VWLGLTLKTQYFFYGLANIKPVWTSQCIVTRLRSGQSGFDSWQGKEFFSSPPSLDLLLWDRTRAFYPMGTLGGWESVQRPGVKLITHFHLLPRVRIRGAIPPFPYTFSWLRACFCTGTFYIFFFSSGIRLGKHQEK